MPKALFNISYTAPTPPTYFNADRRAEYVAQRKFYDLTADYNYLKYTLNGKKVVINANAEHYFTRENTNTGLFNLEGAMSKEAVEKLKRQLKETKSIIWHGFISFDRETSKGFRTQEQAIKFMRRTFGSFLERTNLNRKNIEMYCALHDDKPHHHHIHFAFFERKPMRRDKNGKLGYTRLGKIPNDAIENYMVSANMHLRDGFDEYYTARDAAMDQLKSIRRDLAAKTNRRQYDADLRRDLIALTEKLPATGRLQYNAPNMAPLRAEIDAVGKKLIESDPVCSAKHREVQGQFVKAGAEVERIRAENKLGYVNGRQLNSEEMERLTDAAPERKQGVRSVETQNINYMTRLEADYRTRIGNTVLGICKYMKRGDWRETKRYGTVNDKRRKIQSARNVRRQGDLIFKAIRALGAVQQGVRSDFQSTVAQNEYEIDRQTRAAR